MVAINAQKTTAGTYTLFRSVLRINKPVRSRCSEMSNYLPSRGKEVKVSTLKLLADSTSLATNAVIYTAALIQPLERGRWSKYRRLWGRGVGFIQISLGNSSSPIHNSFQRGLLSTSRLFQLNRNGNSFCFITPSYARSKRKWRSLRQWLG